MFNNCKVAKILLLLIFLYLAKHDKKVRHKFTFSMAWFPSIGFKKLFTTSAHKYVYQCLHKKKHIEDIMKQEGALPLHTGSKRLKQEQIGTVIYFT